jgi:WD40 repeat protein
MTTPVATFTPRAPVALFETAKLSLDTVFGTLIEPILYAEVDRRNRVTSLRNTTAVIVRARVTNASDAVRTVDFRSSTLKVDTYTADVVAQPGQNWLRLDRTTQSREGSIAGYDWTATPPVRLTAPIANIGNIGRCVSWTPDSRYAAVSFNATRFRIYDAENNYATIYTSDPTTFPVQPSQVQWSPDGRYLAVSYVNMSDANPHPFLRVFDFNVKPAPVEVALPPLAGILTQPVLRLAWGGPGGRYLIMGRASAAKAIAVLDWNTGSPVYAEQLSIDLSNGVNGNVQAIAIGPDDIAASPRCRIAISHLRGTRLRVWNFNSATTVNRINNAIFAENTTRSPGPKGLAWTSDGRYLACLSGQTESVPFTVFDFDSGVSVRTPPGPLPFMPQLQACAWTPDGRYLFIGHGEATRYTYYPQALRYHLLYDYDSGSPVRILASPRLQGVGPVSDAKWSPNGEALLLAQSGFDRMYPPTGVDNIRLLDDEGENVVVNGSFEDMTGATRESFGFTAINEIPGWFVDSPDGARVFFPSERFVDARPTDGVVYLDMVAQSLDPFGDNSPQLRQNFNDLVPGATYRLALDVTASRGSLIGVRVLWNGTPVAIDGSSNLPVTKNRPILRATLQPGESANVDLARHMLVYGDQLQAQASGGGVTAVVSYILSTQEQVPFGRSSVESEEGSGE